MNHAHTTTLDCSVCYIAGEFGLFLKHQFEEEVKYNNLGRDSPRAVSEEEVLCLQIAGLCHDLGICIIIANLILLAILYMQVMAPFLIYLRIEFLNE